MIFGYSICRVIDLYHRKAERDVRFIQGGNQLEVELGLEFKHLMSNPGYFFLYIIADFSSYDNTCKEYGLWKNQTNPDLNPFVSWTV